MLGLKTAHFGAFWSRLRPEFDQTEDKQPVLQPGETQQVAEWFPLPRVWYMHREKHLLLQLQANRFYFNWRKVDGSHAYPTFETLEPLFEKYFQAFFDFAKSEEIGLPKLNGAELTYTNVIESGDAWTGLDDIARVLPFVGQPQKLAGVGTREGFSTRTVLDTPQGQLAATVQSGRRNVDTAPMLKFEITVTTKRDFATLASVKSWFAEANATIVAVFLDQTSPEMQQKVWRRVSR